MRKLVGVNCDSGGGAFTIGAIIPADKGMIGQRQPDTRVKFRQIDMQQSPEVRHQRHARSGRIRAALV